MDEPGYRSVIDCLRDHARAMPDRVFIRAIDQGSEITFAALQRLANRMAAFLSARGIGANDRILVLTDNSLENAALYYAILAAGSTYCTINTEINLAHLAEMTARLEPKLVLWSGKLDPKIGQATGAVPRLRFGTLEASGRGGGDELFAALEEFDDAPEPRPTHRKEDIAVIAFTSGTSAAPKGVVHSFGNYSAIGEQTIRMWGIGPSDRLLEYRSLSWASSHMLCLHPCLMTGAMLLLARRFSQSRFFDWVRDERPTIAIGIPTVINMLLERPVAVDSHSLGGLRFMSSSTAPLMLENHKRFEESYGIQLVQLYGMSEGGVVAGNPYDARRIGSVGLPGLYQNLRIMGEDGAALPQGEIGEIEIGGAQTAYGYLLEDRSIDVIRGRRLKTGDLGYLDADGYLHITGRAKDVIIKGGVNIAPLEIDNALMAHEDVLEAASFGVPDPVYGESVVAYVAAKPGRTLDEAMMRAHLATLLPEFKWPKEILFAASIAKTDRGKIDRRRLAEDWKQRQSGG